MVAGTSTTTYRMKLYCKHVNWLQETKTLFNKVTEFYYNLFIQHTELLELSSQKALRELERLTLVSRCKNKPEVPIPYQRIPVYFRRAAINCAIALVHTYQTNLRLWQQKYEYALKEKKAFRQPQPGLAKGFNSSAVFYKGMYKEFKDNKIVLKLFTGKSWCWVKCSYKGRQIPENAELLSPTVVLTNRGPCLHVPVKSVVSDTRTVKERMAANERICGITFTNTDAFAVCVVYNADGRVVSSRFIRGGKEYLHHSNRLVNKIKCNRKVMGKHFDWTGANRKYWRHLRNLSDYWAQKVSREIINYCIQNEVKIITFTKSENSLNSVGGLDNTHKYIRKKIGIYSPYMLSFQIKQKLEYKSWQNGVVTTGIRPNYTANKCSICQHYLYKTSSMERIFRCKEGHIGNKDLNTARNIAVATLKKFGKIAS